MKEGKQQTQTPLVMVFRQSLFWDVDPKTIDPQKHAVYIIERVLDFGRTEELQWMAQYYPKELIRKVVQTSRVLQRKSRALWEPGFA